MVFLLTINLLLIKIQTVFINIYQIKSFFDCTHVCPFLQILLTKSIKPFYMIQLKKAVQNESKTTKRSMHLFMYFVSTL